MGGGPDHINYERDLIKKISGSKFDKAIDHSSDFELFLTVCSRRIPSLMKNSTVGSAAKNFRGWK
jgi:hypothetical protein